MSTSRTEEQVAARHGPLVLAALALLMGFASISTDFYLPAMPAMAAALQADPGTVEYTISGFLVGFSLGQLAWGPLGDRFGRRVPIAIGLVLFLIGSTGCALSTSVTALVCWRLVQAVGACAAVVLSRAMVRDLYEGHRAAQMLSTLMMVMAVAPLLGPILGGWILALAGWRAIFWTLVGVGTATLGVLFTLPETLPLDMRSKKSLRLAFAGYADLLRDRRIALYAGAGGFFYGGLFAHVAATPFAYIAYHHVSTTGYGLLFAANMLGIMAANLANVRMVEHFGSNRLLLVGAVTGAVAGIVLAVTSFTGFGGVAGLAVPLFAYVSATGFVVANSIVGAFADRPRQAGAVSALVGAAQYGGGIIGSAAVGLFADRTPWPMGCVVAGAGLGSAVCAWLLARDERAGETRSLLPEAGTVS